MASDTIRAVLIRVDGTVSVENVPNGADQLDAVRTLIGGWVETQTAVWDERKVYVMFDEDGSQSGKGSNALATDFGHSTGVLPQSYSYAGDVVITGLHGDDLADAPESLIHKLQKVSSE